MILMENKLIKKNNLDFKFYLKFKGLVEGPLNNI
jgi:hypothetical protein